MDKILISENMMPIKHIDGVVVKKLNIISTGKGDVKHALKSCDEEFCGFGEVYFSEIFNGDIKGWKRHNRMTLNIVVVKGEIRFVIYDDREDSKTKGQFMEIILSERENYGRLTVAPGLWMAFEGRGRHTSMLMDIIDSPHDPDESDRKALDEIEYDFNI